MLGRIRCPHQTVVIPDTFLQFKITMSVSNVQYLDFTVWSKPHNIIERDYSRYFKPSLSLYFALFFAAYNFHSTQLLEVFETFALLYITVHFAAHTFHGTHLLRVFPTFTSLHFTNQIFLSPYFTPLCDNKLCQQLSENPWIWLRLCLLRWQTKWWSRLFKVRIMFFPSQWHCSHHNCC